MEKKHGIGLAFGLLVVIGGIIWWGLQENGAKESLDQSVTTYFYGEECPHCKDVRAFLDENKIEEKFSFVKREVWHDRANAALMRDAAGICALSAEEIAVPFVFSEGKCLVGTPKVIDFFKQKTNI
jgi:glutaredoxin